MTVSSASFQVTAEGVTAPTYAEVLEYLQAGAKSIFGSDINLDADTQDGQLLALIASAINDVNAQAIGIYAAYNPTTAIGQALDSAVKVNGITRRLATHSTVDLKLIGQAGTTIRNGYATDDLGQRWNLPATVVIPRSGEILVTATADEAGALTAAAGSISTIGTPTYGWQTVTNKADATPGVAVETDAELRAEQSQSTALPSVSLWEGILGSVMNIDGVTSVSGRKNDTGTESADGIPAHSVAVVAEGGNASEIASTIFLKKGEGVGTYGTTTVTVEDSWGGTNDISFTRPTKSEVKVVLEITPGAGYESANGDEIRERVAAYITSLGIGTSVNLSRVLASAIKTDEGTVVSGFTVNSITMAKGDGAQAAASIDIAWNELAVCSADDVTVKLEEA